MKKLKNIFLLCLMLMIFTGCNAQPKTAEHGPVELGGWLVYWDAGKGMTELKEEKHLKNVSLFTACFDKNDKLCLPKMMLKPENPEAENANTSFAEMVKELRKIGVKEIYLCVDNDIMDNGSQRVDKLKDLDVLRRVLKDDESIDKHADELVALAKSLDCDGLELDYERLWKKESDDKLRSQFLDLTYKLARKTVENGLKLRIILEPSADMGADFCKGPEYIVMLYNLYGTHSGPGPKADYDFIDNTIKKMSKLPNNTAVAFSDGGCIWVNDKKGKFISEEQVFEMIQKYDVKPERDSDSAVLNFEFKDKNDNNCEVWYADGETLNYWIAEAERQGISRAYLWRLGGNKTINKVK